MGYSSLTSLLLSIVCLYCYIMLMSEALRIRSGSFGRVALLDMDRNLVQHAHPHCHVLLKVDGADTQFLVGETVAHLTDESAVLVNAWTPHAYVHKPDQPRCLILALYIEPIWLAEFRKNWASSGDTGLCLTKNSNMAFPNSVFGLLINKINIKISTTQSFGEFSKPNIVNILPSSAQISVGLVRKTALVKERTFILLQEAV